jgi:hypothetical protein
MESSLLGNNFKIQDPRYPKYSFRMKIFYLDSSDNMIAEFKKEYKILKRLSRLRFVDERELILVQDHLEGELFSQVLNREIYNPARFERRKPKYDRFLADFYAKTKMIPMDIRPDSLLSTRKEGHLHLMNFENVAQVSEANAKEILKQEEEKAQDEFKLYELMLKVEIFGDAEESLAELKAQVMKMNLRDEFEELFEE